MKSLVEEYFVLRTNAIQRRRFQNDQVIIPYLLKYSLMYQIEKEHMFTIYLHYQKYFYYRKYPVT